MEKHGGTIAIVSAGLGEGATVTVELPLFDCPELDTVESPDSNSQTECINSLVSLNSDKSTESCSMEVHHVLVVDDAVTNRKMLVRLLERAGHKCSTACNGQDAISVFEAVSAKAKEDPSESPIDTILMDYEMPVLNGPLATQKLRQHGCQALVIGVTGNVLAEDVKYFKDMGADEVFAKPVQVSLIEEYWQKCDWIEGEHIP